MQELIFGTGIAHTIILLSLVIATGLWLGRYKIGGISIGTTWILFVGILAGHFGITADPKVLSFVKDFGLVLFVFSIGLQVGPGFFQSFRKGGLGMNMLAALGVLLAVLVTIIIHLITGESLQTMVGVMSGAVTNTPGLGAAQQTLNDVMVASGAPAKDAIGASSNMASAYAVAYPIGVLGVIGVLILAKTVFKINIDNEKESVEHQYDTSNIARRMHCEVHNPAIFGKTLREALCGLDHKPVISRMMRDGQVFTPDAGTTLQEGDKVLMVTSQKYVDTLRIVFGEEIPMHQSDWQKADGHLVTRRLSITKPSLTGKRLYELNFRKNHGVTVTRILRSGIEIVATPESYLQMGDVIQVVGSESDIMEIAPIVGNKPSTLSKPNIVPIFFGIALGVIVGWIPIKFPGIPQPIKLGLAGGALIVAILLGHFGPKMKITTYTTLGANKMLQELGIALFLAAVGLGAGATFVDALTSGGYWWLLYGALITLVPMLTVALLARAVFKMDFFKICGLLSGGTTDPAVLYFAQDAYSSDQVSVNYATVYPLTMFLRVVAAQLLVVFAFV